MRIGYILEPYEESHASGMGYSVLGLLRELLAADARNDYTAYVSSPIRQGSLPGHYTEARIPKGIAEKWLYFWRLKDRIDMLIFVAPLLPLLVPRAIKTVVLCKEISVLRVAPRGRERLISFVRDTLLMPRALARAAVILASSEATKRDIMERYRVPERKIAVIYEGYQDLSAVSAIGDYDALRPYFFFTGKAKPRKNVHGIVAAFIDFKRRTGGPHTLVIAGDCGGEYGASLKRSLADAGYGEDARFVGYVSQSELAGLYRGATALVFPSFSEGFGMPLVEAMSLGTPVITADASSTGEIAGEAGILVDPHDTHAISLAMERIAGDEELRRSLIEKGYARAKEFSWPLVAKRCLDAMQSL